MEIPLGSRSSDYEPLARKKLLIEMVRERGVQVVVRKRFLKKDRIC
jgi:hypothetical protein